MTTRFETAITNRAAAAIAAAAGRPGPAANTARAWIDSMTARAQLRSERRRRHTRATQNQKGDRLMRTTTRRFAATLAGLLTTAALALAGSPLSYAALTVVSPGEEVDYINPVARNQFCTIGYVYTGADMHTYAITAGHCRADPTSGYARDKRNGLTGDFVRTVFEPPRSGGADYALIDFSTNSLASAFIVDHRMPFIDDHPEPQIGETVCRMGVSSGQQCGQIAAGQGEDQYLTTGMPPSIPGDSGGPVWTPTAHGFPQIIGIWLGEKTTAAGQEYGRFASLSSGLRALNAPGRLGQNSSSPE